MTTEISHNWFEKFCQQVEKRSLVLVYDGRLSHVSVNMIQKAISENIAIIKLPPHSSDKLQLLDACGFEPLKHFWGRELNDGASEFCAKETLSKSAFADVLCCIWH